MHFPPLLFWLGLLITGSQALTAATPPQRWTVGNPDDADPSSPTTGGLLLIGGGGDVTAAMQWFLRQAGGGDVVVLRCSGGDGYNDYLWQETGIPVDSVETLLLTSRAQSYDAGVLATLAGAEAIFIAGGDQSNYVRFWQHTPLAEALSAHVAAGKPLGGTSAGLAVLGGHVYTAMHESDLTSDLALREPETRLLTLSDDFLHLPRLAQVLTDSHFSDRSRLGRLIVMLHRIAQAQEDRPPLGLGVDERTALAIDDAGVARVFTTASGRVHIVALTEFDAASPEGAIATVVELGPESTFDLNTRDITDPASTYTVRVEGTRLLKLTEPSP